MKAKGRVTLRGVGGQTSRFDGPYLLADGGVWLDRKGGTFSGADLADVLGADAGDGRWLFVPLGLVAACTTEDDPAQ